MRKKKKNWYCGCKSMKPEENLEAYQERVCGMCYTHKKWFTLRNLMEEETVLKGRIGDEIEEMIFGKRITKQVGAIYMWKLEML